MLKKIHLSHFKRIEHAELTLSGVNVIVGGNNCGKSSMLQGIHFSISAAIASRQQKQTTFACDLLQYNPTPDFSVLRNGTPYLNQGEFSHSELKLFLDIVSSDGTTEEISYSIKLYKGRNHGNIGCNREGDFLRLGTEVTDSNNLFSIYVPGLAGIAQHEELRVKAIVKRGVASGDANLYLRNIIYYIDDIGKLEKLNKLLSSVFPEVTIKVEFNKDTDHRINVFVNSPNGCYPIELAGTGLLQVLQIYSYVIYFNPRLLLLDEPDSHLHPDNQITLCQVIVQLSEQNNCQILLCSHSRHVVEALSDSANFIWMKDGKVLEQGPEIEKLPLLLDLGALDNFDRLRSGHISLIVLTEDQDRSYLEYLLSQNSFEMDKILCYSYKTSSNIDSAMLFVDFLKSVAIGCKVMIHRDRDFMTPDEVEQVINTIRSANAIPFITKGSDIESYYIESSHLAEVCKLPIATVEEWLTELAREHHNNIQLQFTRKRDDIKSRLYKNNKNECPETIQLIGTSIPLENEKRKGKFMLKKVRGTMFKKIGREISLKVHSPALNCELLRNIKQEVDQVLPTI